MSLIDSTAEPAAPTPTSPRTGWRAAILRMHFFAGAFVGPFILLAAISGGLYAASPTVERFVYADQLEADGAGPARPLSDQVTAAQNAHPDLSVASVRPGESAGKTTRVVFDDPSLTDDRSLAVFVDPATTRVQGALPVYGSTEALPIRFWIDRLHVDLHLGPVGRFYSELAASWMWLVALGGLYLWWRHRRGSPRRMLAFTRGTRAMRQARGGRMSRHAVIGTWLLVGLLFLSATGLTWSKYAGENIGQLRSELGWTKPALSAALGSGESAAADDHADHAGHGSEPESGTAVPRDEAEQTRSRAISQLDTAVAVAASRGVDGAVEVSIPADPSTAITVAQTRQPWRFGVSSATVDPTTGQVTSVLAFSSWPLMAKLTEWLINTHMGWQFGAVNQIALIVFSVLLCTVIVRGYLMWWQRRPARGGLPTSPARGAWRKIEPSQAIPALIAIAFIGWFLPVFGVSLIVFLALDLAIGVANTNRDGLTK